MRIDSFKEVQPWRSSWAGPVMIAAGGGMVAFFGYAIIEQLVFGNPVGDRPMPDAVLVVFSLVFGLLGGGFAYLGLFGGLVTEVREDALYVRHAPLTKVQRFPYDQIESFEARTYRPIVEYGGWGIRGGLGAKGRAYNVSGNRGVQLVFSGGKKLLIGSRKADDLAEAIRRASSPA